MQKTSEIKDRKLLIMDYLGNNFTSEDFAHYKAGGWTLAFNDGSVSFSKSPEAIRMVAENRSMDYGDTDRLAAILTVLERDAR